MDDRLVIFFDSQVFLFYSFYLPLALTLLLYSVLELRPDFCQIKSVLPHDHDDVNNYNSSSNNKNNNKQIRSACIREKSLLMYCQILKRELLQNTTKII